MALRPLRVSMKWIRFIILLLVLTLMNVHSLMDYIAIGSLDIKPDLLLILLVFVSINCNPYDTLIAGFAIGFASDISGEAMGPATLMYGLFAGAISFIRQVVIMKRAVHQGLAVFIVGVLSGFMIELMTLLKTGECVSSVFKVVTMTALYSAVAAPFVWVGLSMLSGWLGTRHGNSRMRSRA